MDPTGGCTLGSINGRSFARLRRSKETALSNSPGQRGGRLWAGAVADIGNQRIFLCLPADAEIGFIKVREPLALHSFPHASLVVIHGWEISISRDVIHKEFDGFASPLRTLIEL